MEENWENSYGGNIVKKKEKISVYVYMYMVYVLILYELYILIKVGFLVLFC